MKENKLFKELYYVPVDIYEEPYFSSRLELYGYIEKYNQFKKDIKSLGFEEYSRLVDKTIMLGSSKIKNLQSFKPFIKSMSRESTRNIKFFKLDGNFYETKNIGKTYLCIDINDALFESVKSCLGTDSFAEFLSDICDVKSIVNSNKVLDAIFNVFFSVLYTPVRVMVNDIVYALKDASVLTSNSNVYFANLHRIIIHNWNEYADVDSVMRKFDVKYDIYKAELKRACKTGFALEYSDNVELYNVDFNLHPMLLRQAKGEEVTEEDLVFKSTSGYLAKFLEIVKYET